jgi:eukaryotic-like serine/threonine-protein kinase
VTEIGSTLGGRYRLVELLGQGGMATIYRARDAQLERDVAVKLLRPELGRDPDFLARFRDEARSAASLSHPNIVAVFDFGEEVSGPYIVMELVEGEDLASIIRSQGPLPPRQAARITAEVAKALQAAHSRGIVHRDVKPSNILVARDGRVKVADFGIARAVTESQLTLPGTTMGSVHYFSPEQARGEVATAASDVYALGIVLYESLTGQRPFSGDGAAAVALARLTSTPPRPSALRAGVPAELDQIVLRAMALEPDARFPSAAAMASALEGFLSDQTHPGGGPGPAAGAAAGAAAAAGPAAAQRPAARPVAAAQARPNRPVPYPPEAYAAGGAPPASVSTRGAPPPPPLHGDDDGDEGSGPWAWVAGLLGLAILAVVGIVLFSVLTSGGSPSPSVSPSASPSTASVTVPNFVGMDVEAAKLQASAIGLTVVIGSSEDSDRPPNEILSQDPPADAAVGVGTEISVVTARGPQPVAVPDLRGKTESEALQLIVSNGLTVGTKTEGFDPFIEAGAVMAQQPGPGIIVAPGAPIDYTLSKGPEPTPTPTPPPTPSPTPPPTPSPTPPPTPSPTPAPINVGDYSCMTLADATTAITNDRFTLGTVTTDPADTDPIPSTWIVESQAPTPGKKRPANTSIDLVMADPTTVPACAP